MRYPWGAVGASWIRRSLPTRALHGPLSSNPRGNYRYATCITTARDNSKSEWDRKTLCGTKTTKNFVDFRCQLASTTAADKAIDEKPIEDIYQRKTPIEHVLLRPGTSLPVCVLLKILFWVLCIYS